MKKQENPTLYNLLVNDDLVRDYLTEIFMNIRS
jgi:hypothetical protein